MAASEPGLAWHEGQRLAKAAGGREKERIDFPEKFALGAPTGSWWKRPASDLKAPLILCFYPEMTFFFYCKARVFIQRQASALLGQKGVKDLCGVPNGSFVMVFILSVCVCWCVSVNVSVTLFALHREHNIPSGISGRRRSNGMRDAQRNRRITTHTHTQSHRLAGSHDRWGSSVHRGGLPWKRASVLP